MNKRPVSYLQTDRRWADKDYSAPGETTTIRKSGCGPTCAAMLIETLTGEAFTPADACAWALKRGYKALKSGTYYSYFVPQFKAFGIGCQRLNTSSLYGNRTSPVHEKAFELLRQGYYLIACMGKGNWTSGGHYIVVWWEDGKVRINDPASTRDKRLNGDPETFKSQVKYYWAIDAREHNRKTEDDDMTCYKTIGDVPQWYREAVRKVVDAGALKGTGDALNVSDDLCRTLTILDRLGVLDRPEKEA